MVCPDVFEMLLVDAVVKHQLQGFGADSLVPIRLSYPVIYYVRLPQPIGKDKYTFVHLLKESPYPLLNALPINPIHYITHMLSFYFVINSYANTPSAQYFCKNTKKYSEM